MLSLPPFPTPSPQLPMRLTLTVDSIRSKILRRPSPPSKMAGKQMSVRLPPMRFSAALTALDEAEIARMQATAGSARTNTTDANDADGCRLLNHEAHHRLAYAECSYTTQHSQQNRTHNRWADIFAFDHSLLPGPYLNASLIPPYPVRDESHDFRRSYVASQAPLPQTLTSFYEHVVRHRVRLIVNLTPFRERGRVKADEYWPLQAEQVLSTRDDADDHQHTAAGSTLSTSSYYNVRLSADSKVLDSVLQAKLYELDVTRNDADHTGESAAPSWHVRILHVTTWADFGNYDEDTFARLLSLVEQHAGNRDNDDGSLPAPIWVHCSAGVGRSGTVIAALMARDLAANTSLGIRSALQLRADTPVPALLSEAALEGARKLVDHARRFRPRLVQTGEQLAMVAAVVGTELQRPVAAKTDA